MRAFAHAHTCYINKYLSDNLFLYASKAHQDLKRLTEKERGSECVLQANVNVYNNNDDDNNYYY